MKKLWFLLIICLFMTGCNSSMSVVKITENLLGIEIPKEINYSDYSSINQKKIAWGLGPGKNEKGQPIDALNANDLYGKYNASFIGKAENKVYLTFDAGYENGYTANLLDTLKEKKVSAVFYLTMQYLKENPDLVHRMIKEGHQIGNHTWRHKSFSESSLQTIQEEIMAVDTYLKEYYEYDCTLVRPPKGEFTEQSLALIKDLGYHTSLWSMAYFDWDNAKQPSESEAMNKLMKLIHPGAIILLHANSLTNKKILGSFIDQVREKGYEFIYYDLDK